VNSGSGVRGGAAGSSGHRHAFMATASRRQTVCCSRRGAMDIFIESSLLPSERLSASTCPSSSIIMVYAFPPPPPPPFTVHGGEQPMKQNS
jgi:hypothetical protein